MTFEDIRKANEQIVTTDIKGKAYAEVNQRIKAFRMVFPDGFITTEIRSLEDGVCVMVATVGFMEDGEPRLLGTGTAYEKETSSFINKTSFIENCETSAVGRALGMAGFGIDTSVASAEEVQNAIKQQEERAVEATAKISAQEKADKKITKAEAADLTRMIEEMDAKTPVEQRVGLICQQYGVEKLEDLKKSQYTHCVNALSKGVKK